MDEGADRYNLQRFLDAQHGVYEQVLRELQSGHKTGHWMWFIFPQIQGLGHSAMSRKFAIVSIAEARACLAHAVLGPRLEECTRRVTAVEGRSLTQIFGEIDAMKFHSSMTLFARAAGGDSVFTRALGKYCAGQLDDATLQHLG